MSGVDVAGATFLINDVILKRGVVFAYSAFFRSNKPVRLQIWRPLSLSADEKAFRLVSETRVVPSLILSREDVSAATEPSSTQGVTRHVVMRKNGKNSICFFCCCCCCTLCEHAKRQQQHSCVMSRTASRSLCGRGITNPFAGFGPQNRVRAGTGTRQVPSSDSTGRQVN